MQQWLNCKARRPSLFTEAETIAQINADSVLIKKSLIFSINLKLLDGVAKHRFIKAAGQRQGRSTLLGGNIIFRLIYLILYFHRNRTNQSRINFVGTRAIAQLPVVGTSPGIEFTGWIDRQAVVISRGDLDPICGSANFYRAIFIANRAIAQLPVVGTPPGVEFTVFVDRKVVVTSAKERREDRFRYSRRFFYTIARRIGMTNYRFIDTIYIVALPTELGNYKVALSNAGR